MLLYEPHSTCSTVFVFCVTHSRREPECDTLDGQNDRVHRRLNLNSLFLARCIEPEKRHSPKFTEMYNSL